MYNRISMVELNYLPKCFALAPEKAKCEPKEWLENCLETKRWALRQEPDPAWRAQTRRLGSGGGLGGGKHQACAWRDGCSWPKNGPQRRDMNQDAGNKNSPDLPTARGLCRPPHLPQVAGLKWSWELHQGLQRLVTRATRLAQPFVFVL